MEVAWMVEHEFDSDALHPTYLEIYRILGDDKDSLFKIFEHMSGQQLNLPVHLYEPDKVKRKLSERVERQESIDVNDAAKQYGYSRRWIRTAINDANRKT